MGKAKARTHEELVEAANRNCKPEPNGGARYKAEVAFWECCRFGNEGRLRRALDDAWAAAMGRPLVWSKEWRPDDWLKPKKKGK